MTAEKFPKLAKKEAERLNQVNNIIDTFSACKTIPEVNITARHYGPLVVELEKVDKGSAERIKNKAKHRRWELQDERFHSS